jgi:hypothetical protein
MKLQIYGCSEIRPFGNTGLHSCLVTLLGAAWMLALEVEKEHSIHDGFPAICAYFSFCSHLRF